MRALPQRTCSLADDVGKAHAQIVDPIETVVCVVAQHFDEVQITDFIAAVPRLQRKPFFRIEEVGSAARFVRIPL